MFDHLCQCNKCFNYLKFMVTKKVSGINEKAFTKSACCIFKAKHKNVAEHSRNNKFCRVEPGLHYKMTQFHHEMTQFQPLLLTFTLSILRSQT